MNEAADNGSVFEPYEGDTGNISPEDLEQSALQSIRDRSRNLLADAFRLQTGTEGDEIYVTRDDLATPLEDAWAILLTRDGRPPQFEESKEQIYIYFPALEGEDNEEIIQTEFPMLWLEYINESGQSDKVSVTSEGIKPYQEQLDQTSDAVKPPVRRLRLPIRKRPEVQPTFSTLTPRRWRDMIKGFRLSSQPV